MNRADAPDTPAPLRLLHFTVGTDTSGYFRQLARGHDRGRYRVYFGTLDPTVPWLREFMESQDVPCFSCGSRARSSYPVALARLVRFLRSERIDILHTHLFDASVVGLIAGSLARTRLRLMTRHYSDYHTRIDKTWHVRLDGLCSRLSHGVIAVSRHTAEHLVEVESVPPAKVFTVPNGIDFDRVHPSGPGEAHRLRGEFGAPDKHLLLVVGRLHPEKGYEYLFRAMAELKRRFGSTFLLLVAGEGLFRTQYESLVRSLDIDDVVRFLGFRRDVQDLMEAADMMVLPSLAEAFGLALTEALYVGTPVVATRVGGIPEIVSDGVDGVLVPPADEAALTAAIASLLADPERLARMRGAGREKVRNQFNFEDMVRAYESVYERLSGAPCEVVHA